MNTIYITTLIKIIGITYVAEFASGICKDAGYSAIAGQIEVFAKIAVMALSMPVLIALLETIDSFLS
jgi:stage III sporulation protein AD